MYITPNGSVTGSGVIIVGLIGVLNEGTLSPGITILTPPLANALLPPAQTQASLATMNITGTLTISPTGRLEIPVVGNAVGEYGSLNVSGTAVLDGVLALQFSQGYAPQQGDTFTLLVAEGNVTGTFDSVEISGLMPGFEYEISIVDGQVVLEALNDGVPLYPLFLPLVLR